MNDTEEVAVAAGKPAQYRLIWLVLAVALIVIVLDQFTKWLVVTELKPVGSVEVIGSFLRFVYTENTGAAFSMGNGYTWIFTIIAVVVAVVIIRSARKLASVWWAIALGGLLGGALGNLIDRLTREPGFGRGYVVDFIAFPHFAIFNVADMAVTGSAILMVILSISGVAFSGKPSTDV